MWKFLKRKSVWIPSLVVVVLVIGYLLTRSGSSTAGILTEQVKQQDLAKTVLATGQVTSTTDLDLAFKTSGVVNAVSAKVGQVVKAGDVLASLKQPEVAASVTQARGAVASAQANFQKVLDGASNEQVQVAQAAVDVAQVRLENSRRNLESVKRQQDTFVSNAEKTLLNSTFEAVPRAGNLNTSVLPISGTYNSTQRGRYTLVQEGNTFYVTGLETVGGRSFNSSVPTPLPVGTRGLTVTFPANTISGTDEWTIDIPNTRAANYVANLNAYNSSIDARTSAIQTAESEVNNAQVALDQAKAQLEQTKSAARPAEIAAARAQILTAQGQLQAALANLENGIIRAPVGGTITTVDVKPGEQATALKTLIVLQDVGSLHVEANISEANIDSVKLGQAVSFTFDALGPDRTFMGTVSEIDPASTVVSGVVNYKVTAAIGKVDEIKPGMTANLTIQTAEVKQVLAVPLRAVVSKDGKKVVRVVTNEKTKAYNEVEVVTGLEADGGLVEITSGLTAGQTVVTFVPAK